MRAELVALLQESAIFRQWHWFRYHFEHEFNGAGHPLAQGIIESALACEARMPGYARALVERLAAISGREKHLPDWEQLLTMLAELFVVAQIARWPWPDGAVFTSEPTAPGSNRNPEVSVRVGERLFAYEVKAPNLFAHQHARGSNPTQIASRYVDRATLSAMLKGQQEVTWPRDNPVKDFLVSAEDKFRPFVAAHENFTGILVICWDDFVFEPISALAHPNCGLFTAKSFFRTAEDKAVEFPSVGGVVVIRHLHQLIRSCQDRPLSDGLAGPFDYGAIGGFPWKSFHQNPFAPAVQVEAIDCLDARIPVPAMGTEYFPKEYVMWLG